MDLEATGGSIAPDPEKPPGEGWHRATLSIFVRRADKKLPTQRDIMRAISFALADALKLPASPGDADGPSPATATIPAISAPAPEAARPALSIVPTPPERPPLPPPEVIREGSVPKPPIRRPRRKS